MAARPQAAAAPQAKTHVDARVDINHASVDKLLTVQGMTRTWAERVVRFRPYRTKQDLLDRGVLPSEVYERIKDGVIAHREKQ
jgi:DNA uptake protein ComE-like DNA-binding protein